MFSQKTTVILIYSSSKQYTDTDNKKQLNIFYSPLIQYDTSIFSLAKILTGNKRNTDQTGNDRKNNLTLFFNITEIRLQLFAA